MIDVLILRIIAGVLLVSSFLLIYVVNFRGKKDEGPYEVKTEVPYPSSIEAIGAIATFLVPIGAIILMLVTPSLVYETALNIYFAGDTFVQVLGIIAFVIGGALLIWSARHLGKFDVGKVAVSHDHFLVDTGPYARVRHPGNTGTFLVVLAVLLLLLNVLLILDLVAAAGYFVYRARLEERLLSSSDGLGEQYLDYMKRTGRFFPRLRVPRN
ncbi:MAG: methyltransferase family protein [Candidatus Thorarchaeota archaeon]|jgi:protein-S-isoprenylcysteine O-methyltransferase Ste14